MRYAYKCQNADCEMDFEVYKSMHEASNPEFCEKCGSDAKMLILPGASFYGAKDESASYNRGLGMVVKNRKHAEAEARARGMEPIGNECPNKTYETLTTDREKRLAKRWDD